MQFLHFLEGQLLIARILKYKNENRMRYPENGWYEKNDYIAFASASFRQKKNKKPSAGFRDCSPVPFSKFYDTILHIIMSKINDAAHLFLWWILMNKYILLFKDGSESYGGWSIWTIHDNTTESIGRILGDNIHLVSLLMHIISLYTNVVV